jgi:AbrB family looped-hinge helix DNA binding protein
MLISSKGQVTIPAAIRREAGLLPNTEVEFVLDEEGRVMLRPKEGARSRGERLVEKLRGFKGKFAMSTDELMVLTRGEG